MRTAGLLLKPELVITREEKTTISVKNAVFHVYFISKTFDTTELIDVTKLGRRGREVTRSFWDGMVL